MKLAQRLGLSLVIALLALSAQAEERPSEKEFKGMELYSWQDAKGDWVFALLPGTNRLKSEAEIKEKESQIAGTTELEKHFLRLAEGEEVFWFHRDLKGFAYPDEDTMKAIASSAQRAKVELRTPPEPSGAGTPPPISSWCRTRSPLISAPPAPPGRRRGRGAR
jgi:hypothetical protein